MGSSPALVTETLGAYAGVVSAEMLRYLSPAERPDLRRYLYDLVAEYPRRWGKMMRPSICLATAQAFGARLETALPSAASIELLHNSLLIHDDIEDQSDERRGLPTLHRLHGLPLALNAGSALSLMSLYPLIGASDLAPGVTSRLLRETVRVGQESAEGQALELGWCRDNHLDLRQGDYLELVLKKTCWLATIHPLRVGALLALGEAADLDRFVCAGFFLGAAFQIHDDVLNLIGDAKAYGKELAGDLWEGKRTLVLIELLERCSPSEREELRAFYGLSRAEKTQSQVTRVLSLMHRHGSIEAARGVAEALAGAAQHELEHALRDAPESRHKEFLRELPTWVFERAA
ncbi:MAG: polyprenyl synthetase family protein [Myxococcales bacterium]|nr:MAG: polyprenyl synthetase family protein [Myxococcales bacterium]